MRFVRAAVVAITAGLVVFFLAAPAMAHGRGSDASNYDSRIAEAPDVPGMTWRIYNGDEYLGVSNQADVELTVLGYRGEPYLRIGPDGTFANTNSEAWYLNRDRFGATAIPAGLDPDAAPEWEQVSTRPVYAWHDHRIHWMGLTLPPQLTDTSVESQILTWEVPVLVNGEPDVVSGALYWVPGSNPVVWLLPALLLVGLVMVPAFRSKPDLEGGVWPGLGRPAAMVLAVISALNVLHLVDDLVATPLPFTSSLVSAVQTLFFIAIGLFGALRCWQQREGAFTALGVGSVAIFIGQGLLYAPVLASSQDASIFPGWVTRAIVALSLVQVVPLVTAAILATRRLLPPEEDEPADVAAQQTTA